MKSYKFINIFILTLLLAASCVPSSKNGKRTKKKVDGSITPEETNTASAPNLSGDIRWYDGQYIDNLITINEDYQTLLYIRGQSIHNFLDSNSNSRRKFCLVFSFNQNEIASKNSYRVRAIPISINNFSTQTKERLFKLDFVDKQANTNDCSGTVNRFNTQNVSLGSSAQISYLPSEICPNCTGLISSLNLSLYESTSGISELSRVNYNLLDLKKIALRVDVKNNTTSGISSCSDVSCSSQNFDCCLEGQCVKDGAMKPNPDPNDLNSALADVSIDSSKYINWPSVYFVCGNNVQRDPTSVTDPVDASAQATEALNNLIAEFDCLEEGKQETPNFTNNNVCLPSFNTASYEAIRKSVWLKCGCQAFPFPSAPDEPYCPDFGLKKILNDQDVITDIQCDIPVVAEATPIQSLQLVLSARSAPHRFYDTGGISYDDLTKVNITPTPTQEGEEFSYLDPSGKTTALKTTFSINAILGQMTLDLSQSLPAKMLDVEFDQTYIITALSGFYTPCSSCAVDSWFTAFSPHPTTQNGLGLRAVGHTANRQVYNDNVSNGNYEDTIFGRACWLPPTMLPFTHKQEQNLITQRNNRLEAQAALYINGYQRDWFGFNKGAIIGSFDGVRWFAIGKGRRVIATSKKLYLAINAPFADLADNTSMTVSIITDLGVSTASNVDYDPDLSPDDPLQNEGASCQRYHQCQVDSDCVSQLGWEYTCGEVDQFKTHLPKFDENADEVANSQISKAGFDQFLHGTSPTAGQKRCIYRGAGSVCKVRYNHNGLTDAQKKIFTCAPNFYCESLSGNQFNEELVRTSSSFNNILFGQDSDILGRPLNYNSASGSGSLNAKIKDNIINNASIFFNDNIASAGANDFGLCRPGKNISENVWSTQHQSRDTLGRTDYISQISSCESEQSGDDRYSSCPAFDSDGNYLQDITILGVPDYTENKLQNMCGKSSISSGIESSFKNIESGIIGNFSSLFTKKVPVDACLRRAGAVCHTDLDCSPGKLHGEESQFFDRSNFGNTEAELNFWQESLVCSQAEPRPLLQSDKYFDYDITKNRCCREVGKTLTMFTVGLSDVIPENTNSELLDKNQIEDPLASATGRYSRYASLDGLVSAVTLKTDAPHHQIPLVEKYKTPNVFQWKTINDTGRKTCCGGGWIRKFADGTHDWKNRNRLSISPENFKCINYQSDLPFGNNRGTDQDNYLSEYSRFCLSPGSKGCLQIPIGRSSSFNITPPLAHTASSGTSVLSTVPDSDPASGSGYRQFEKLSHEVPYMPLVFKDPADPSGNLGEEPLNFFLDNIAESAGDTKHWTVSIFLPAYISLDAIERFSFVYMNEDGTEFKRTDITGPILDCGVFINATISLLNEQVCVTSNHHPTPYLNPGNLVVLHAKGDPDNNIPGGDGDFTNDWKYGGIEIEFYPQNSINHPSPNRQNSLSQIPGNDMYYLTRLGKLELIGIPQIVYEPLYCNTDSDKLVPGIFDLTNDTRADFQAMNFRNNIPNVTGKSLVEVYEEGSTDLDFSNPQEYLSHADKLNFTPIFSGNEFLCCQELGTSTSGSGGCCSNFSIEDPNNPDSFICALPSGTNLNVYFNRFVSGEGSTGESPFIDTDFIPETGELKLKNDVYQKLITFGVEFCENNTVRGGGAFGYFNPGPHGTEYVDATGVSEDEQKYYSIVDETADYDTNDDSGYGLFRDGFRWNHHQYCE